MKTVKVTFTGDIASGKSLLMRAFTRLLDDFSNCEVVTDEANHSIEVRLTNNDMESLDMWNMMRRSE